MLNSNEKTKHFSQTLAPISDSFREEKRKLLSQLSPGDLVWVYAEGIDTPAKFLCRTSGAARFEVEYLHPEDFEAYQRTLYCYQLIRKVSQQEHDEILQMAQARVKFYS